MALKGLPNLRTLNLTETTVEDAGLEKIKGLAQLQWLSLVGTKVTEAGMEELEEALPNCIINVQ